jgi:hypothetical protein
MLRSGDTEKICSAYIRHEEMCLKDLQRLFAEQGLPIDCQWGAIPYRGNQIMKPFVGPVLEGWQPSHTIKSWIVTELEARREKA